MTYGFTITPQVYNLQIRQGSTADEEGNQIHFPGIATFCQIQNRSDGDVDVYLEDCDTAFTLDGNSTQIFSNQELHLTHIAFENAYSGGLPVDVTVIVGVTS